MNDWKTGTYFMMPWSKVEYQTLPEHNHFNSRTWMPVKIKVSMYIIMHESGAKAGDICHPFVQFFDKSRLEVTRTMFYSIGDKQYVRNL